VEYIQGHETDWSANVDQTQDYRLPKKIVMRRITTGINSEKGVVRQFHCCVNVTECPYTNLDSIAYYTPSLYGIAYCS